ncbi:MAG: rhamnulose-1-phosphate aldolase [Liquorilactobacillus nagelii]|jgi:rhamnulose-1-phosphate aldolase|uniref:Rhamnulose-1-phosphate aldolase n=3 Tax=Liquorilactobacillus nagelii TaxID=82688 RepID=A0A3S6QXM5_9LACO|nr:rhamnulose-1-phosphate aldolase [Liquorilactobacillus nagelii]AUJ32780.1 rhamnulose-1-phosphate aldolase [Liquorilactobacillus nagelii]MCC7617009.1 rhamnulose-1-phosphate aldolase [Liquorilactobacillus nagelii]MCP9315798.1 rhamnulose-1-phosphate aldolase [Liquorilactobacillus nagelii]
MTEFVDSKFVKKISEITHESYVHGWDERNGGNVSLRIDAADLKDFEDVKEVKKTLELGFDAAPLAGEYFLVTGTGRYFRNVINQPKLDLGLVQITPDGQKADLLWGFEDGGLPTSEFPSHLMTHIERLKIDSTQRVVMHCHPTNTIALSFTQDLDEAHISRLLWKMQAESLVVFPEGIGVIPYMTPGTNEIGRATAAKMKDFRVVMWPHHGIFGVGASLDETFGLIETVEKAATIYSQIGAQGGQIKQSITDDQLRELAAAFKVTANPKFL